MPHLSVDFRQRIFNVVAAIPFGKVATYGDVARLAGSPRAARQVGSILKKLPLDSTLPWHRIVNRYGKISLLDEDYLRQKEALLAEKILFSINEHIDLTVYRWQPEK